MTELSGNLARMLSTEPALLPGQRTVHQVNRDMMQGLWSPRTGVAYLVPGVDPVQTRDALHAVVPDMFVVDGDALLPDHHLQLHPEDARRFPRIRPGVDTTIDGVLISTWGVHLEKKRRFAANRASEFTSSDTQVINLGEEILVEWPQEYEWKGHVGVTFWHQQGGRRVGERLEVETDHGWPGEPPTMASRVGIFNGDSYTYYRRSERQARDDEEVMAFLGLVRQLNARLPGRGSRA